MSKLTWLVAAYAAMIMLGLAASRGASMAQPIPERVTAAESQNGGTVELSKDQQLVIRLPAQLGTGFSWAIQSMTGVAMQLVKSDIENGAGIPGAPETQVFVVKPAQTGNGEIELAYRQPWMRDKQPAKTFKLHIIVR